MTATSHAEKHIRYVTGFQELVSVPFTGDVNAICWKRHLEGDFSEVIGKIRLDGNVTEVGREDLLALRLSEAGNLAREVLLNDLALLEAHGASPNLNVIENYERDDAFPFFPTDVYSFHADRSPIPVATFLCTYIGEPSDILPNEQAVQKVLIPGIRDELKKLYDGTEEGFAAFLSEHSFDLHYQAKPDACPVSLGLGHMWRLAVEHPGSSVLPCIHRAPEEKPGQPRLLMIC